MSSSRGQGGASLLNGTAKPVMRTRAQSKSSTRSDYGDTLMALCTIAATMDIQIGNVTDLPALFIC
jgi:hypothetical protein